MIVKIKSANKLLLDILYKNPNTDEGLYLKELKDGVLVGNAVSENEYHCVFFDSKHSYMPEEGSQIDFQSHCSPLLALNIGTEFFNHLYKEKASLEETVISWLNQSYKEVDTEKATVEIATFFIDSGWFKNGSFLLSKYIEGITVTPKVGNNYELKVEGESVIETIHKFSIVALFTHFTNRYAVYTYIDDFFIQKYITMMTNISGIPYFVFYLFIKRIMRSPVQFDAFKPQLEAYFNNQVQFVFTDTHQSRKEFICTRIHSREHVLDFGCGEMQYYKTLMKKGFDNNYFGYDEVDFEGVASKISETFKADNLVYLNDISLVEGFKGQIILSEVIEHNTLEEAKALMVWIQEHTKFTTLYITTPDKDFNSNYEMVDEFRHDDHDFELSNPEFITLINTIFPQEKAFFGIGDCVNGIFPTSGVIIQKK